MEQGAARVAEVTTSFCSIVPAHDTRRNLPRRWGSLSLELQGHSLYILINFTPQMSSEQTFHYLMVYG